MARKPPPISESDFLSTVLGMAKHLGWLRHHTWDSRIIPNDRDGDPMADVGFPDLVLVREGHLIFAELKTEGGVMSNEQMRWAIFLDFIPNAVSYLWRPSDLDEIQRILEADHDTRPE